MQFYIGSSVKVCASSADTDVLQEVISGCLSSNLHSMLLKEKVFHSTEFLVSRLFHQTATEATLWLYGTYQSSSLICMFLILLSFALTSPLSSSFGFSWLGLIGRFKLSAASYPSGVPLGCTRSLEEYL